MPKTFKFEVVTPEKVFYSDDVELVVFNRSDGEMGVMEGHEPMVVAMDIGELKITKDGKTIIVNLTSNFGNGGGTQSVNNRVRQISRTVKSFAPNSSVYLHIEGKEVEYLGGDGVYIKQPIE